MAKFPGKTGQREYSVRSCVSCEKHEESIAVADQSADAKECVTAGWHTAKKAGQKPTVEQIPRATGLSQSYV